MNRYSFTNWTSELFTGRFGGQPYEFNPGEVKEFDPDKHYMLIVLSKQLADQELIKGAVGVGRDPNNPTTFGKSLGADGKPWIVSAETRKEFMRKAIGELVDTPIPTPDQPTEEAGATKGDAVVNEQIAHLTELVENLTKQVASSNKPLENVIPVPEIGVVEPKKPLDVQPNPEKAPVEEKPAEPAKADLGMAREALYEMAVEAGLNPHEQMTKEELIESLNKVDKA